MSGVCSLPARFLGAVWAGPWRLGRRSPEPACPAARPRHVFYLRPTREGWEVIGQANLSGDVAQADQERVLAEAYADLRELFPTVIATERIHPAHAAPGGALLAFEDQIREHVDGR